MKNLHRIGTFAVLVASAAIAASAPTGALFLKINGANVQGESTIVSMNRANTIEVLAFENKSSMATGRRTYEPIVFRKRIDKSSPLLAKALTQNQSVDAEFRFYRTGSDGQTRHFYTVEIKSGKVAGVETVSPELAAGAANVGMYEEVKFSFATIKWRYEDGGIEHEDTWNAGGGRTLVPLRPPTSPLETFLAAGQISM